MRGDLQVIDDVDVILEKCPKLLIAIRNLLAYKRPVDPGSSVGTS